MRNRNKNVYFFSKMHMELVKVIYNEKNVHISIKCCFLCAVKMTTFFSFKTLFGNEFLWTLDGR